MMLVQSQCILFPPFPSVFYLAFLIYFPTWFPCGWQLGASCITERKPCYSLASHPQGVKILFVTLQKQGWFGGGGVLPYPYMSYIGMCGPKGYGFSAVFVINRVSILVYFGHFGHK